MESYLLAYVLAIIIIIFTVFISWYIFVGNHEENTQTEVYLIIFMIVLIGILIIVIYALWYEYYNESTYFIEVLPENIPTMLSICHQTDMKPISVHLNTIESTERDIIVEKIDACLNKYNMTDCVIIS